MKAGHLGPSCQWGVHLSFLCSETVEFCGLLGFEWMFLDAQHQPLTPHLCRDLVRAADAVGITCWVRVPEIKPAVIESHLDVGVRGILAPDVSSIEDAQALVAAVKFAPEGRRGAAPRTRAARYGLRQTAAEYFRAANQATFTAALIENQQGIDALEAIMAVPGLDYVALGPNDLGLSMGTENGMADPRVRALVEAAESRIKARGKPQLAIVQDADQARRAEAAGATLIAVSDAALLLRAASAFLEDAKR